MSDNKNTEQVQGFFVRLITHPNTYAGVAVGLVLGYLLGKLVG